MDAGPAGGHAGARLVSLTPARLPRGRHGLSRVEVADSQRRRLMRAMADEVAERGYVATSVAGVASRAGVSRESFYQQFDDKLDCFLACFDTAADLLFGPLRDRPAGGPWHTPLVRFDDLLGAYLQGLVDEPAYAKVFLVEVYAAGPPAVERRAALQATLAVEVAGVLGVAGEDDLFACRALVAAVSALVTPPLVRGDLASVAALRAPLVALTARLLRR
jgi:AcrR family transcriptional regulator